MDVYEAMAARRTIRDFAPRDIPPEVIRRILSAGLAAPTNNHMREWHFVLLQDRARRKALLDQVIHPVDRQGAVNIIDRWGLSDTDQREMYIDGIPKQYSMLYEAGCLILPCFCQPSPLLQPENLSALNGFASVWCCIENILVAAAAEGIFGVTRIPFDPERQIIKQFLGLPADHEVPCWLALGYPAENAFRAKQVTIDLEARLHLDAW